MSTKESLAIDAKNGDQQALSDLIVMMGPALKNIAASVLPERYADQDEAYSEALSRIPKYLEKWNPKRSSFGHFCETCARNRMLSTKKTLNNKRGLALEELPLEKIPLHKEDETSDFEDYRGRSEIIDDAIATIHTLSPSQRMIVLAVVNGVPVSDIANELGVSEKDARQRIKAAVKYISFSLREKYPELQEIENGL